MRAERLAAAAVLLAALWAPLLAQDERPAAKGARVMVGARAVLTLAEPEGSFPPADRAAVANSKIEDALLDPQCGPEGWVVTPEEERRIITLCGRRVIAVTPADAAGAGVGVDELAGRWSSRLQAAYAGEKQVFFSTKLLQRALTGLLLTLAFLGAVALAWFVSRQIETRVLGRIEKSGGVSAGPIRILSTDMERRALAQILLVLRLIAYALLTYFFLAAMFQQFPFSARIAERMLLPLPALLQELLDGLLNLLPRIGLGLLILIVTRVLLRSIGRLFDRVREHKVRLEPLLSADTAGPAELTARVLVIGAALLTVSLLVPGRVSNIFLAAFALAGFALALGARELTGNLIWGIVTIYARPFRRGQRVRVRGYEGIVRRKGVVNMGLEMDDGRMVLIPNSLALENPIEIVQRARKIFLDVVLEAQGGPEAAAGIIRNAAVEAGLKREEGGITLLGIREGRIGFSVEWPVPEGGSLEDSRAKLLKTLYVRSQSGAETRLVSAAPTDGPSE